MLPCCVSFCFVFGDCVCCFRVLVLSVSCGIGLLLCLFIVVCLVLFCSFLFNVVLFVLIVSFCSGECVCVFLFC